MSFYKESKNAFEFGWLIGIAFVGFIVIMAIVSAISIPFNILGKTFNANNIIYKYEWFHDVNANINSRVAQIKAYKQIISETTDKSEISKLRIELSAVQQTCRDLTNQYNANSNKVNVAIFKNGVPSNQNPSICE